MKGQSIVVTILGKDYTIEYPNVGQVYQMEAVKQLLGKGYYNSILAAPTRLAQAAADAIEIEALFSVLSPKLLDDLKVKSFGDLGLDDFRIIQEEYKTVVYPWLVEIGKLLTPDNSEKEENSQEK